MVLMVKSLFVIAVFTFLSCSYESLQSNGESQEDNFSFEGKLLRSLDNGITWESIGQSLPVDSDIRGIALDHNNLYIGFNKDSIFVQSMENKGEWHLEDLDKLTIHQLNDQHKMITGIFSGKSNHYIEVVFGDLYKKEFSSSDWVPVNKPKGIDVISSIQEDVAGNVYLGTSYGLYVSKDGCNTWDQIKSGWISDFEVINDEIFISSVDGLLSSKDQGKSWHLHQLITTSIDVKNTDKKPSYSLLSENNRLISIENEDSHIFPPSVKIQTYLPNEKKWKIHPSNSYIAKLRNITSFVVDDGKLYCSYDEGVLLSEDNGVTWNKVLNYQPMNKNSALMISVFEGVIYCWERGLGC
jgi:hypothetical protein